MKPQDRNRAIWASRLDTNAKVVALAIADHVNTDDQEVYPSAARLASMTGLSERTVRDVIRAGRAAGWLVVTERPGHESLLRVVWSALANTDADRTPGARKVGTGRRGTPEAGAGVPRNGAHTHPGTGRTPPLRPVQDTPAPRSTGRDAPTRKEAPTNVGNPSGTDVAVLKGPRRDQEGDHSQSARERDLPPDLTALGISADLGRRLIAYEVTTPTELLSRTEDDIRHIPGIGPDRARVIARVCREAGWPLGSLPPTVAPPGRGPPGRGGRPAAPSTADALAELAALESGNPPPRPGAIDAPFEVLP
jgi:hypothetical protein